MSWLCFSLSPFLILSLESSLSLSFRLRRRQFKCQTSKKPLFRGVNRPLGKSSLALSFSHTNTLLRIKPHSRTKLTLYFSLSSISLPHSIFKTYLHLSFSLSLSLCFFFKPPPITQSLSLIYTERLYQFFENYFSSDSQNTNQNPDHNSLSLAPSGAFVFATVFGKIIKN